MILLTPTDIVNMVPPNHCHTPTLPKWWFYRHSQHGPPYHCHTPTLPKWWFYRHSQHALPPPSNHCHTPTPKMMILHTDWSQQSPLAHQVWQLSNLTKYHFFSANSQNKAIKWFWASFPLIGILLSLYYLVHACRKTNKDAKFRLTVGWLASAMSVGRVYLGFSKVLTKSKWTRHHFHK